jgi:hypothetical protein
MLKHCSRKEWNLRISVDKVPVIMAETSNEETFFRNKTA